MIKRCLSLVSTATLLASMLIVGAAGAALANVNGAAFTTDNPGFVEGGPYTDQACTNGPAHTSPGVNCNIYGDKRDVWINGGPSGGQNHLSDGSYFFAVLVPGGQPDPNDGSAKNLSSPNDTYGDRTFSISGGHIDGTYAGPHNFDVTSGGPLGELIQLAPYNDTTNPGGVYILAICSLDAGYPVKPSDCKYDAFKVQVGQTCQAGCGNGQGAPLTITKGAVGSWDQLYTWTITKTADKTVYTAGGADGSASFKVTVTHDDGSTVTDVTVSGTISVFNPNVVSTTDSTTEPVDILGVTDSLSGAVTQDCTVTDGGPQTLSSFETDFAYSCDLGSTIPVGELDNTATVSWAGQTLGNGDTLALGSADFVFSNVTFAFSGTYLDTCVTVNDTNPAGPQGVQVCAGVDDNPKEFDYSGTVSGGTGTCTDNTNIATVGSGDVELGRASATVSDCQGSDLTVSKTATPSYTRTYNWTIHKTTDKPAHIDQHGGTVTLNYYVTATETGFTDSAWTVTGTITVTNPNDWEAISLTSLTDAVDNGGVCVVSGDTLPVSIAASGSHDFPYTCTYSSAPSPASGTNTATAGWDGKAASTPHSSADGTKTFDFSSVTPATVHKIITVQDSYNGGTATTLGTLTAVDSSPLTTHTYGPLTHVITVPTNGCVTITNSGIIKETGDHSDVSNTICGTGGAGALTMGYWQNKNGQAIITGQAKTGTCPSATYLRTFNPFMDLSSTATCAQVGTYVTNIIKAANASGASMNAMLKAQMLATALDVYFSDPTKGGNKIGAPAPIGGDKIDLTAICAMIDSSSGTGTCSGTLLNVSAAFPGISGGTCATVSNLLLFANATFGSNQSWGTNYVSNSGGVNWYGQVKATQQLAKNTFDAINNQAAFAC